jgi:hypothetical protein
MNDAYEDLARTCRVIARRRPSWVGHPSLVALSDGGEADIDMVIAAVRDQGPNEKRSDAAVAALLSLTEDHPDALTVLLAALAPILRMKLHRGVTEEYKTDALGDLVFVLCDTLQRGDAVGKPRIVRRLLNRTHNRSYKRARQTLTPAWAPEWIDRVPEPPGRIAVADLAAARADLATFGRAIQRAIDDGRLPASGWETFVEHRLVAEFVEPLAPATSARRSIAARTARRIRPLATTHLAGHAA